MLKLSSFEETGLEDIPLTSPTRVTHRGCSEKQNATVTRTPVGWVMHCFKCGEKGFQQARVAKLPGTMTPTMTGTKGANKPADMRIATPTDYTPFGVNDYDLRSRELYYSDGAHRLMFKLSALEQKEKGWAVRATTSYAGKIDKKVVGQTKWIIYQDRPDTSKPLVFCHGFGTEASDRVALVLCEDPISALKIAGRGTNHIAIALLGLRIPQELLVYSATQELPVIVWPDGDPPGIRRGRMIYDQVKFLKGDTYFTYVKGKDPKDLTNEEIREHLASIRKETGTVA